MSIPENDQTSKGSSRYVRISVEVRRTMDAERIRASNLRMVIDRELEAKGIRDPSELAAAFGLSAMKAERLLTRRQWRLGDLALLEALAVRLGVEVPN
jgi:hypothetical protein